MVEFLQHYGILIGIVILLTGALIYVGIKHPKKIKEWLVFACAQAELSLGGGTGMLKLRLVYDMFISQFPVFSKIISFNTFQKWTEEALVIFKEWLENNTIQELFNEGDNK